MSLHTDLWVSEGNADSKLFNFAPESHQENFHHISSLEGRKRGYNLQLFRLHPTVTQPLKAMFL